MLGGVLVEARGATYLAFAICPEICNHANNIVQSSVGALVYQESDESADRVDDEAGFDGAVQAATS